MRPTTVDHHVSSPDASCLPALVSDSIITRHSIGLQEKGAILCPLPRCIIVSGLYALLCLAILAHPALAQIVSDDFNGGTFNTSLWKYLVEGQGATPLQTGGRLTVSFVSDASGSLFDGGIVSQFGLKGDFDFQVDHSLDSWPSRNGVRLGFDLQPVVNLHRVSRGPSDFTGADES